MFKRSQHNILLATVLALFASGHSVAVCLAAGSAYVDGTYIRVTVEWSQGINPQPGSDFFVVFHDDNNSAIDAYNPAIRLASGDLQWRVESKFISNSQPANIASLTTTDSNHYKVKIAQSDGSPGAANLGSADLDPAGDHYSSILPGSSISGKLTGTFKLYKDSNGDGGVATGLVIGGSNSSIPSIDTGASLIIPVLAAPATEGGKSLDIKQEIKGSISIELMQDDAFLDAVKLSNGGSIHIYEMDEAYIGTSGHYVPIDGAVTIDLFDDATFAYMGPFATTGSVYVGEMGSLSTLYINNYSSDASATGASVTVDQMGYETGLNLDCFCEGNDPPLAVTVNSIGEGAFLDCPGPGTHGSFDFGSIGSWTTLQTSVVRGLITLENGIAADAEVDLSGLQSTGVVDLNDSDIAGTLSVTGETYGTVANTGAVSGIVSLSYPYSIFHGNATFASASGQINTGRFDGGTLTISGNLTGTIATHGDVNGTINVNSDIGTTGVIDLRAIDGEEPVPPAVGNLSGGAINVGGNIQAGGSITVQGESSGTIQVLGQMSDYGDSHSLVRGKGGLGSGGYVNVNSGGDSSTTTAGTVWLGADICAATPSMPFAGILNINACDGGTFAGLVKVVGCSATNHGHANICINGVNSGTITYVSGCCGYGFTTYCTGSCGG